ncbi:conserved exported hypothetical protein [Xanthomonas citri pv. bilvae]|nr:conserved exported hypothetical protein [Xanthomonas citri pv. bilvae]
MRREQCTKRCRRVRSCASAACLGIWGGGIAPAGVADAQCPRDRQPLGSFACSDALVPAGTRARFGKRRAACFVFGNGFSAGCVMPDHAGEQWRASIAER